MQNLKNHWRSLVAFLFLIIAVQAFGNLVTMPNIPTWYADLAKPEWNPPNWLFGPVWTILYLILAVVGWRLWISFDKDHFKQPVILAYFVQLFFNAMWSPIFFGAHLINIALSDLLLVIIFTVLTMSEAAKFNRTLSWWLVPYLAWLCYAASLNGAIAYLN